MDVKLSQQIHCVFLCKTEQALQIFLVLIGCLTWAFYYILYKQHSSVLFKLIQPYLLQLSLNFEFPATLKPIAAQK